MCGLPQLINIFALLAMLDLIFVVLYTKAVFVNVIEPYVYSTQSLSHRSSNLFLFLMLGAILFIAAPVEFKNYAYSCFISQQNMQDKRTVTHIWISPFYLCV